MSSEHTIRRWLQTPWLAEALAGIGGLWYTLQLWGFAHLQESVLDEGAYLYKGYLFASGQYIPYQPYGPWTNHTPLAFLIPGAIQLVFGPGIRTARYASIVMAVLMLLGVWILARRFGNRWWAAAAVWALALNPAMLKAYSTAVSQGLVACMLVWTLVLVMGERRPLWQIVLGSGLAGLMVMTRINMLPVLPLLPLLYVPDIRIYPSQIYDGYSFLKSGDDLDLIARFGRWNEVLAQQWVGEADYTLIEERSYRGWIRDLMRSGNYEELSISPPTVYCRDDSQIRVFKRMP